MVSNCCLSKHVQYNIATDVRDLRYEDPFFGILFVFLLFANKQLKAWIQGFGGKSHLWTSGSSAKWVQKFFECLLERQNFVANFGKFVTECKSTKSFLFLEKETFDLNLPHPKYLTFFTTGSIESANKLNSGDILPESPWISGPQLTCSSISWQPRISELPPPQQDIYSILFSSLNTQNRMVMGCGKV